VGDIRNLKEIGDNTIDLIVTHPPYLDIIKYSDGKIKDDLSTISSVTKFVMNLKKESKSFTEFWMRISIVPYLLVIRAEEVTMYP